MYNFKHLPLFLLLLFIFSELRVTQAHAAKETIESIAKGVTSPEAKKSGNSFKKLFCRKGNAKPIGAKILKGIKSLFSSGNDKQKKDPVTEESKDPSKAVISVRAFSGRLCNNIIGAAMAEAICTGENPGEDPTAADYFVRVSASGKVEGSKCHINALKALEMEGSTDLAQVQQKAKAVLKEKALAGKDAALKTLCENKASLPQELKFLSGACSGKEEKEEAASEDEW